MINTVVGSGTLITFPVLLAFGYAPVTANVVEHHDGLVPGSVSGAIGYRRELSGQRKQAIRLGAASVLGGITGAVLLLALPATAFAAIVPVFIGLALVLIVLQPRLNRLLAKRATHSEHAGRILLLALYATGVYGRLFWRRSGDPAARHPRSGANTGPAPNERLEERAGRFGQRRRRRVLPSSPHTSIGRQRRSSPVARSSAHKSGRGTAAA